MWSNPGGESGGSWGVQVQGVVRDKAKHMVALRQAGLTWDEEAGLPPGEQMPTMVLSRAGHVQDDL